LRGQGRLPRLGYISVLHLTPTALCSSLVPPLKAAGINAPDVVRSVPVAHRTLEEHFAERIGQFPGQESQRVRLEKAKQAGVDVSRDIGCRLW